MEIDYRNTDKNWTEIIKEFDSDHELAEFDCKFGAWADEKLQGNFYRKFDIKSGNIELINGVAQKTKYTYVCKFYFENKSDAILFKLKA